MMRNLVDGDMVVYGAGFAVETRQYKTEDGILWPYISQAKEHCSDMGFDIDSIEKFVESEPVSHALYNTDQMIKKMIEMTGADECTIFLSGDTNFRNEVATLKPYKGNRVSSKPVHYQAIRDHLVSKYDAVISDGVEADDLLGIHQEIDTVICTLDKDLDMVPGSHYNWRREELYWVTEPEAIHNFYNQLLMGDAVDNIPGVPGIGKAKAAKILAGLTHEPDLYEATLQAYIDKYDDPHTALQENATLLWIQQADRLEWRPPNEDDTTTI